MISPAAPADDRLRLGRRLIAIGVVGVSASLVVGVAGWVLAVNATTTVTRTVGPVSAVVDDVVDSIEATEVMFERTTQAIESIETATRSSVRTIESVGSVLVETAELTGGGIADSLDAAVDTLPGMISTSSVVDSTMRALSLVGVDYDPETPLDESLRDLEASLAPVPGQIREQVALIEDVRVELEQIADDGRELAAVLLEARLDMIAAERVLRSARSNAQAAAESVAAIGDEVGTYEALAKLVALAAALALLMGSLAPLLLGIHLRRRPGQEPTSQPET